MNKIYKSASYGILPQGCVLLLDNKPARTPLHNPFIMPSKALAEAVAEEWQSQGATIQKETMRLTQIACVAIDLAALRRAEVLADILPYGETDLLCYRVGDIPALAATQAQLLDPVVVWAHTRFGIILKVTDSVMPVTQPPSNSQKITQALAAYDDWKLAALACAVKPLGSLVLALALTEGRIDADEAFRFSHLEETFETEKWGADEEKEKKMSATRLEIDAVARFLAFI